MSTSSEEERWKSLDKAVERFIKKLKMKAGPNRNPNQYLSPAAVKAVGAYK